MCVLAVVTSSALLTLTREEGDYYTGKHSDAGVRWSPRSSLA